MHYGGHQESSHVCQLKEAHYFDEKIHNKTFG